jgi:hypothetical protein
MDTSSDGLFVRIREKCQRDGWYGGELDGPTCLHVRPDHPQRIGFAYPPASAEQLLATEEALGFPLPPVLRALYAEVANGGFGFGYGLRGAIGGFDESGFGSIVDHTWTSGSAGETLPWCDKPLRLIDLADNEDQWEESTIKGRDGDVRTCRRLFLTSHLWPELFLPICYLGCGSFSCLDCRQGGVYYVGVTKEEAHLLSLQAPSLVDMFERWVQPSSDNPLLT